MTAGCGWTAILAAADQIGGGLHATTVFFDIAGPDMSKRASFYRRPMGAVEPTAKLAHLRNDIVS
jgi:hypothetical protein